ncbi:MAG: hypothetical protein IPO92_01335 [Saprospiraceae bacterium]|nr:hypothetical protein [Saprospiraceae bacterium]
MTNISKRYYAKLLLFGEYTVTLGSGALSIPYTKYSGSWSYSKKTIPSRDGLLKLYNYLASQHHLSNEIQLEEFKNNIQKGLYFDSDIPLGYGLGSSGALVAAFLIHIVSLNLTI